MKVRELKLIIILSLFLTIIINVLLIRNTYDFGIVKLAIKSHNNVNAFITGNDSKIIGDLSNSISYDLYKENRQLILEETGKIHTFKLSNVFENFKREKNNKFIVDYVIESELKPEGVGISMVYDYYGNDWSLVQVALQGHDLISQKSMMVEKSRIEAVYSLADEVLKAYIENNYEYIYSTMSQDLRERKSKEDLLAYLNYSKEKYGVIKQKSEPTVDFSKNGDEYKFVYLVKSERIKNLSLIVWIKAGDTIDLSGIKFTENAW